ncbi:MAG: ribosome recycling factor, partial [Firmicutes bacterium]|nr:ribosome recycling factor [Bacillota bacterium]
MYQPQVSEKINNFKSEGAKRVEFFKKEISQIKAGRANPNILNKITVDYYGNPSALNQVANISVPEARQIVIAPWDATLVKEIVKAILASDLGITPNDDGKVIRLNFPALTEEKRREIVKEL